MYFRGGSPWQRFNLPRHLQEQVHADPHKRLLGQPRGLRLANSSRG